MNKPRSLRSCLKQPGSASKNLRISFHEQISLVTGDGDIFLIDLPDTICNGNSNDETPEISNKKDKNNEKPRKQKKEKIAKENDKSSEGKEKKLTKEKTSKEKKDKTPKEKKKKEKKETKNKILLQEQEKPQGATPERTVDRTGMFIVDWMEKLFANETLPKNYAEILKDLFLLPNSRTYFLRFLADTIRKSKGQATDLNRDSFTQFVKLSGVFVIAAENSQDYQSIASFVPIFNLFKLSTDQNQDFMYHSLRDLQVWKNNEFWCFMFERTLGNKKDDIYSAKISCIEKISGYMQQLGCEAEEIKKNVSQQGELLGLSTEELNPIYKNIKEMKQNEAPATSPAAARITRKAKNSNTYHGFH